MLRSIIARRPKETGCPRMESGVDLIIPMLNEAPTISALFDALDPLRERGVIRHVVVGDNGSTDGSPERAADRGAIVVHEPRLGYGAACLAAIRWIEHNADPPPFAIAFLDADLADDPTHLERLVDALADCELALGSRRRLADPGALNFPQRFGGALATLLVRLTTGRSYTDLGPMRAIRWGAYQRLRMADRTWGWTVEMQMKAAIAGMKHVELHVPYRRRHSGKSKISGTLTGVIKAGTRIIATIFVIRLTWRPIAPINDATQRSAKT